MQKKRKKVFSRNGLSQAFVRIRFLGLRFESQRTESLVCHADPTSPPRDRMTRTPPNTFWFYLLCSFRKPRDRIFSFIFEISRSPLVPDRKCLFHFYPRTIFPLFSFIWFSSFRFSHVESHQRKSTVGNVLKTRLQCALLIPSRVAGETENVNSPRNERRADERRAKGTSRLSVAFRLESSCLGLQSHSCRRG